MIKFRKLCLIFMMAFITSNAYAGEIKESFDGAVYGKYLPCPDQAIQDMDIQFGIGTSDLTKCIQKRTGLKSVIAWNLATVNGRTGFAQQAQVTRNTINNWTNMYDMEINKDFKIVVVGYAAGGRWLLSDEAYNRTFNVTTGNPTRALTETLIAGGVPVYMCQNTMRGSGWVTADLISGVLMVPSGASGILDFQHNGYKYLNP